MAHCARLGFSSKRFASDDLGRLYYCEYEGLGHHVAEFLSCIQQSTLNSYPDRLDQSSSKSTNPKP